MKELISICITLDIYAVLPNNIKIILKQGIGPSTEPCGTP